MKNFSSYAVFEMVLEEANDRFAPMFRPLQKRLDILKEYCSVIDQLIESGDGESFNCSIDEKDMTVKMSVCITDVESNRDDKRFNELIRRAVFVQITNGGEGEYICVKFVFPSLWELAV